MTVLLADGCSIIHRMYHGMPKLIHDGQEVGAVHGFARKMVELLLRYRPSHCAVAVDTTTRFTPEIVLRNPIDISKPFAGGPNRTVLLAAQEDSSQNGIWLSGGEDWPWQRAETTYRRNALWPTYKANRRPKDIELEAQFLLCKKVVEALGCVWIESRGYEADDVIASLVVPRLIPDSGFKKPLDIGPETIIVSSDKDLLQLTKHPWVTVDPCTGTLMDGATITRVYGFDPVRLPLYFALVGDAADNLPGVPGIGPVAATAICQQFSSLDDIYTALDGDAVLPSVVKPALAKKLREHKEQAFKMLELVSLDEAVPHCHFSPDPIKWQVPSKLRVRQMWQELGLTMNMETEMALCQMELVR